MDEWEEESMEQEMQDEDSCDYGVSEICCDPWAKQMGLCTTECKAYLDSLEGDQESEEK